MLHSDSALPLIATRRWTCLVLVNWSRGLGSCTPHPGCSLFSVAGRSPGCPRHQRAWHHQHHQPNGDSASSSPHHSSINRRLSSAAQLPAPSACPLNPRRPASLPSLRRIAATCLPQTRPSPALDLASRAASRPYTHVSLPNRPRIRDSSFVYTGLRHRKAQLRSPIHPSPAVHVGMPITN